ncbi:MAG: hypothetical protein ACOCVG_01745 [Verrucomicrobiota bacterium]
MKDPSLSERNEMIFLLTASRLGWEVTMNNEFGIQLMQRPRIASSQWVAGAILSLVVIGIIILLAALVEQQTRRPKYIYVTKASLDQENISQLIKQLETDH